MPVLALSTKGSRVSSKADGYGTVVSLTLQACGQPCEREMQKDVRISIYSNVREL